MKTSEFLMSAFAAAMVIAGLSSCNKVTPDPDPDPDPEEHIGGRIS